MSSTVFDSIMIGSWLLIKNNENIKKTKEAYQAAKIKTLVNLDFQKILAQETMRSVNIRRRANEMYDSLRSA